MSEFPIFLKLAGRRVVIVGGGETATRKVRLLARSGAALVVIASQATRELCAAAAEGRLALELRPFDPADLAGAALVVAAPEDGDAEIAGPDDATVAAVSAAAQAAGIPVNVVDRPGLSTFLMPALVDRAPLLIAISSGGAAPVLARSLRAWLESRLPARLGVLASFAGRLRRAVAGALPATTTRRRFWEALFAGPVADAVLAGREDAAGARVDAALASADPVAAVDRAAGRAADGVVHLVGAGPGDPDLLTFKALRVLQEADVIVYDRLVAPEILERCRRDADRIAVGKAKGRHSVGQAEIEARLVAEAAAGRRVVRLKGGDPLVFARGGEELDALKARGIRVEVVPGITAALGCAAAAGIPLTHRDEAAALTLITGHGKDDREPAVDWPALARGSSTLAVYMGLTVAGRIARRLIDHGLDPATPVAVIVSGTRADQEVRTDRLGGLGALAAGLVAGGDPGPALLIIGTVARRAVASAPTPPLAAAV